MEINNYIKRRIESINLTLDNILPRNSKVGEAARYMTLNGGSRWRPLIMIAAAEMYDKDAAKKIMPNACSIELGHTASLIFDDKPSMDNAYLRRGKESCHIKFGEDIADLTGIFLINYAYQLNLGNKEISPENTIKALRMMGKSTGLDGLVGGQEKDLKGTKRNPESLEMFYAQKSGGLYALAASMGGILYNADKKEIEALVNYGKNLGVAYQFIDDVLDVIGDQEEIGKSTNMDKNKLTSVHLFGVSGAVNEAKKIRQKAIDSLSLFGKKADTLRYLSKKIVKATENKLNLSNNKNPQRINTSYVSKNI
ncbi:polyprenyl synthetase family protein [Candidatus Woesearchaeota archaeon]|nr:polyprenyl synthetase family protein [Candidatus Woesearchaeota archaeon]